MTCDWREPVVFACAHLSIFTHGEEVSFGVLDNLDDQGELTDGSIIAILTGHPFGEFPLA